MTIGYLVDTDWAIHYLNGHPEIVRKLQLIKKDGLRLSIVSLAELFEGVCYSRNPEESEAKLNDFISGTVVVGIDEETCRVFGKERGRLRKTKKVVGDFDLLIGATDLAQRAGWHKQSVVPENLSFRKPEPPTAVFTEECHCLSDDGEHLEEFLPCLVIARRLLPSLVSASESSRPH